MAAPTIPGLFVIPSPNNGAVGGEINLKTVQALLGIRNHYHLDPRTHIWKENHSAILLLELKALLWKWEVNPQLCSPKESPKRTRNGNFAPNGVKNGPKRAAMVQKELKMEWKFLRIVFWRKKNCRIVVVCGGGCVPNSVCEETISTKINSRTQEVGSTD